MNRIWHSTAVIVMLLLASIASGPAVAQSYGYVHGWGGGGGVRLDINVGAPLFGPAYYPAPYFPYGAYAYPAPVYVIAQPARAVPSVYVEQGPDQRAVAPAQPQNDWYYCAESRSYYPHVRECAAGWQSVPAQPPENSIAPIPPSPGIR